jgi:hypothetical protein
MESESLQNGRFIQKLSAAIRSTKTINRGLQISGWGYKTQIQTSSQYNPSDIPLPERIRFPV